MLSIARITRKDKLHACITREALTSARNVRQLASRVTFSRVHFTRHEDRFVVHSRVTREFPGKICERLQRRMRASVKFKLSHTVALGELIILSVKTFQVCTYVYKCKQVDVLPSKNQVLCVS